MKEDPRLAFIIAAVHSLTVCGTGLEVDELTGLKMIMESIVMDSRGKS